MRAALLLALALSGCTVGTRGHEIVQARGATVALAVRVDGRQQILAGELLAVEPDHLVVDSFDAFGQPRAVVSVPHDVIARGTAYVGSSPDADVRALRRPPPGLRRVLDIRPLGGRLSSDLLVRLSRFPGGVPDGLMAQLLEARGQTEVGGPDQAELLDAIR